MAVVHGATSCSDGKGGIIIEKNGDFKRKEMGMNILHSLATESAAGVSIISIATTAEKSITVLAEVLQGSTPGSHLRWDTTRGIPDLFKCGVPFNVPADPSKPIVVCRNSLHFFLSFFHGNEDNMKIDPSFLMIIQSVVSSDASTLQPTAYTQAFSKGILIRLGSALSIPPTTKPGIPVLNRITHAPGKRKANGMCMLPKCPKGVLLDPGLEAVGLPLCINCSGLTQCKGIADILTLSKTNEMPAWIPQLLKKLMLPDLFLALLGSALLQTELNDASFQSLVYFAQEWCLRAPETCFADPHAIGILWKLHLMAPYSREECTQLGHVHWGIQQADASIGRALGSIGCTDSLQPKAVLLATRKVIPKVSLARTTMCESSVFFSSIVSILEQKEIRFLNMGSVLTIAAIASGLLRVVICGSAVGIEDWMQCRSEQIQKVDLRSGRFNRKPGKTVILGCYGHMINYRTLMDIAVSEATALVLLVDYPLM